MKLVILCGGMGTRMQDYSFPKPLNMIYGKPSITYCLSRIPDSINNLHFIYNPLLRDFNFEEIIKNEFKSKTCTFFVLPYVTRGAIESAYLGLSEIEDSGENIVFLDNDVLYDFPVDFFTEKPHSFLGYAFDNTGSTSYSFLEINQDHIVVDFKEKKRISNLFCCGVYGFTNSSEFRSLALSILQSDLSNELYLSLLFQKMLKEKQPIQAIHFTSEIRHIGTLTELEQSWNSIQKPKMRVCFDLDNTLVSYPTVPNDYSTVRPIYPMITLAQRLHNEGHTIIIHTARRMKTHEYNVGSVIKDIGMVTFKTLEQFQIPYDEILFGKPIADIYIDDRAVNPYKNDVSLMGYLAPKVETKPLNSLPTNKFNRMRVEDDFVVKSGPIEFISGEIYYYQHLPLSLQHYFPKFKNSTSKGHLSELKIEYIKGISFYSIYQSSLLTTNHISMLLQFMSELHHLSPQLFDQTISITDLKNNYTPKLKARFQVVEDYPFEQSRMPQEKVLELLEEYESRITVNSIVPFIHGDLWFSNIMITFTNQLKVLDMKGKIGKLYSTSGDPLYDYAKVYQSLLGFDSVLYNHPFPSNKDELCRYFESSLPSYISLSDLKTITFALIIGTMHFISTVEEKTRVWNWMVRTFL